MVYALRALWFALLRMVAARLLSRHALVSDKPYDFAVNVTASAWAAC